MIPGKKELCVLCGRETEYTEETPVELREGYTDGGQLCRDCEKRVYEASKEKTTPLKDII